MRDRRDLAPVRGLRGPRAGAAPGATAQGATGTVEIAVAGIPLGARVEAVVLLDPRGGRHPALPLTGMAR